MDSKIVTILIIGLIVIIALFLIFRELNCWYWKINERIRLQKTTNNLLSKMIADHSDDKMEQTIKELPKIDLENIKDEEYVVMKDLDTNETVKITYFHYKNRKLVGSLPENHAIIKVLQD